MLAIIIPYYKYTFFESTLQSLANQTNKNFKVYIGDDASPESPSDLLEKFKGKFDFEYHRFESNLGGISLTKQWERCISLSSNEEWLMILGDDDYLEETFVSSWYNHYDEFYGKSCVIRFASKIINMKLNSDVSNLFSHPLWENAYDSYYRKFKGLTRSTLSEYVFFKKSYLKYGFKNYPLAWGSDSYAWLEFPDGKMIYTINQSTVYIRYSDYSISGSNDNAILKNKARIQFLENLITQKFQFFKKKQKLELLMFYETSIKEWRKLKNNEWYFLFQFYIKNFTIISSIKFMRRFFKSTLNL